MIDSISEREGQYIADPDFAEKNRTIHAHFTKRLSAFTSFDANLNSGYADAWQKAIDDFEAQPSDETEQDGVQVFTDELNAQYKNCWQAIDDLEYYVKRAFPNNKRKLREFGFPKTRTERERGVLRMALNMNIMKKIADDYSTELTGAGMPVGILSNLETQTDKLVDAEMNQEYQKRLRLRSTEKRIELYNNVYNLFHRVREAANVIYRSQEETKKLFEMG